MTTGFSSYVYSWMETGFDLLGLVPPPIRVDVVEEHKRIDIVFRSVFNTEVGRDEKKILVRVERIGTEHDIDVVYVDCPSRIISLCLGSTIPLVMTGRAPIVFPYGIAYIKPMKLVTDLLEIQEFHRSFTIVPPNLIDITPFEGVLDIVTIERQYFLTIVPLEKRFWIEPGPIENKEKMFRELISF